MSTFITFDTWGKNQLSIFLFHSCSKITVHSIQISGKSKQRATNTTVKSNQYTEHRSLIKKISIPVYKSQMCLYSLQFQQSWGLNSLYCNRNHWFADQYLHLKSITINNTDCSLLISQISPAKLMEFWTATAQEKHRFHCTISTGRAPFIHKQKTIRFLGIICIWYIHPL